VGDDLAFPDYHDVGHGLADEDALARETSHLTGTGVREPHPVAEARHHFAQAGLEVAAVSERADVDEVDWL
jgi:hypothetical protein